MDVLFAGNTLETLQLSTSGSAQFSVPTYALPVGSYTLTSSYGGDSNYAASTSAGYTVTLSAAPTSTSLVITPTQATPPGTILFTATVSRTASGAQGTPTGTVGFYYGTILLGTGTLNPQGLATFQVPDAGLPAATYSITAKYNGDSSDVSSISSPATVTIE
jgi:hypothetical protein